jgi:hypothetical protein
MPKPSPEPLPRSRYSYERVRAEIRTKIPEQRKGKRDKASWGLQKQVADHCNLSPTSFNKRLRGISEQLKVEHLGAIADFFNAPRGWPLISWVEAEAMEDALKAKSAGTRTTHAGPKKP